MKLTNCRGSLRLCSSSSSTFGARRKAPRAELFGDSCSVLMLTNQNLFETGQRLEATANVEQRAHLFCCEYVSFCNLAQSRVVPPFRLAILCAFGSLRESPSSTNRSHAQSLRRKASFQPKSREQSRLNTCRQLSFKGACYTLPVPRKSLREFGNEAWPNIASDSVHCSLHHEL